MIDYQMGNNDYSLTVINKLSDSLKNTYLRKKSKKRAKRLRYKKSNKSDHLSSVDRFPRG